MTLGEHLDELRRRLIRGAAAVFVAFVVAWVLRGRVSEIVLGPYDVGMTKLEAHFQEEAQACLEADAELPRTTYFVSGDPADMRLLGFDRRVHGIKPGEHFLFVLKVCLYFAVTIGAPVLLWEMWQFVSAGLYDKERRFVLRYFPPSVALFAAGVLFGYFLLVPYAIYFLNYEAPIDRIELNITLDTYLTFLSSLCLALGLVFQIPILMSFLGASDMVKPSDMAKYRGHFVVGSLVLAAILTPPDPITQLMLGVPMIVLYEVGIWAARMASRSRREVAPS